MTEKKNILSEARYRFGARTKFKMKTHGMTAIFNTIYFYFLSFCDFM